MRASRVCASVQAANAKCELFSLGNEIVYCVDSGEAHCTCAIRIG